jgi:uncharacterized protein YceK
MNKLILALIATVILSGCTVVTSEQIAAGQKACEPNGGLQYLMSVNTENFEAVCNNGVEITARNEDVSK